jgi:hypothetical protein
MPICEYSGLVVELYKSNGGLYARTGMLSPSNPKGIEWSDSVRIGYLVNEVIPRWRATEVMLSELGRVRVVLEGCTTQLR